MAQLMKDEDDCKFKDCNVRISDSAILHLRDFDIGVFTLCDMLNNPIDCPKRKKTGKKFRPQSERICAKHKGRIFNIILDPYIYAGEKYWSVSHLEPIS